ncbi:MULTISPECIES: ABC transporter ATP-binding protein [unclassified Methylobacterium]|uniref:ABC transporter ATP-binding protein n=1 Tax=unclassified Methylobacterium TaxID=2615210 RepID=UPI000CB248DF|nr:MULTISPECIES: ABC transporter ATP-binding protein [unclassified Methylobacterium]PIU04121.1 MAG: ABC transporter [Methylobacterium sp. CG09_land_8_20_14_0_10_71_15]PIU11659.1 MAG: ABC transporter [Methylobacterium sp. CG08_land_8_20_14_0_20_71_15]GBU17658.1 iron(3+)-hydroxamate import ABC transporter ATPase [Methylobacterium sp.]
MSLRTEALAVRLGGRTVLDGVSLALAPGTMTGLVGPNGAGKTTLLRALAGLLPPAAGRVLLDERPVMEIPPTARARRIAALFQGAEIGWPMSVRELVALGRAPHRRAFVGPSEADRAAVERALRRADLLPLAERSADTLSTGERMRALLARALAVEAGWLLADEPVTALDPGHQIDAMHLLRMVAREGVGVVAVLHDLSLAARFCDRLVVLAGGRIAADGTPAAVLDDALLATVFGIGVARGIHRDGTAYILPWDRRAPHSGEESR